MCSFRVSAAEVSIAQLCIMTAWWTGASGKLKLPLFWHANLMCACDVCHHWPTHTCGRQRNVSPDWVQIFSQARVSNDNERTELSCEA